MAVASHSLQAQTCTPAGDETSYGTADTWIGYVYDNMNFTSYAGYVNEGLPGNANFNETFGGDNVNYATNGCPVYTETFSVRYKLQKTFAAGNYQITVGGDDGFRLSLDGGATWVIDRWYDQSYNFTTYSASFSGSYNMVLEYYENGGGNRVSFRIDTICVGTENQAVYGTGNIWKGYIYTGTNFNSYSGLVTEGTALNPNFDENFGGDYTNYATSACSVVTEQFSARYRLQKTFAPGNYTFLVGGDDGFRLSLDGGATWVINQWWDQGYTTASWSAPLSGTVNMVLEYYENAGSNRVSFAITSLLPVTLTSFNGSSNGAGNLLNWKVADEVNTAYYQVERSNNGIDYTALGKVNANGGPAYLFTDGAPFTGINYYRLRITDKDGAYSYAAVIKIAAAVKQEIQAYPSVVNHEPVHLKTTTVLINGMVELYDMTGKQLQQIKLPVQLLPGQAVSIPLPAFAAGSYVLICKSGTVTRLKQIIVIK